nr:MAG TPA_asm: PX-associated [Bacteriophage sp.]
MPEQKHYLKNILYKIIEKLNSLIGWTIDAFNDI